MGKKVNNPTGRGGFQQHPENINRNGALNKGNTFRDILIKKLNENYIYGDPVKTYKSTFSKYQIQVVEKNQKAYEYRNLL